MSYRCHKRGCVTRRHNGKAIFRVPLSKRLSWLGVAVGKILKDPHICSDHFQKCCIDASGFRATLKHDALPTSVSHTHNKKKETDDDHKQCTASNLLDLTNTTFSWPDVFETTSWVPCRSVPRSKPPSASTTAETGTDVNGLTLTLEEVLSASVGDSDSDMNMVISIDGVDNVFKDTSMTDLDSSIAFHDYCFEPPSKADRMSLDTIADSSRVNPDGGCVGTVNGLSRLGGLNDAAEKTESTNIDLENTYGSTCQNFSHATDIMSEMYSMWLQEQFLDATIMIGQTKLRAHKMVLLACSTYLRSYWSNLASPNHPVLQIVMPGDISVEYVSQFLEYLYRGVIELNTENVRTLLRISNMWHITNVRQSCEAYIARAVKDGRMHVSDLVANNAESSGSQTTSDPCVYSLIKKDLSKPTFNDEEADMTPCAHAATLQNDRKTVLKLEEDIEDTNNCSFMDSSGLQCKLELRVSACIEASRSLDQSRLQCKIEAASTHSEDAQLNLPIKEEPTDLDYQITLNPQYTSEKLVADHKDDECETPWNCSN